MYAVIGRIIEAVGGPDASMGWGEFVRRRIFLPLSMQRSCSNRDSLKDQNFAEPHTALDHDKPARLAVPLFSDKTITGASAAVWSTVPDMLKWAAAILQRLHIEVDQDTSQSRADQNPLRQISMILSQRFRVTDNTINENSYGLGWARHLLPSKHLGWLSINGPQPNHIIGKESRPRLAFYHGGQITGYLSSVYLFPETDSAVIVLTNAQGAGDCSDWIAQAIIQELFDLQPRIDFHNVVENNAKWHLGQYNRLRQEYERNQLRNTDAPSDDELVGTYYNSNIKMTIEVFTTDGGLEMQLNGLSSQRHKLSHYHYDAYGFLPASREEQQLRCLVDYFTYEQFLLRFKRDDTSKKVTSLAWKMQDDFDAIPFVKSP
jgi:CubicO group peptidase (beta-lactamase class C family)